MNVALVIAKGLCQAIGLYQRYVSPYLPAACRFTPSCSEYAKKALEKYGPTGGVRLAILRLLKCHPFHPGGQDPLV